MFRRFWTDDSELSLCKTEQLEVDRSSQSLVRSALQNVNIIYSNFLLLLLEFCLIIYFGMNKQLKFSEPKKNNTASQQNGSLHFPRRFQLYKYNIN